MFTVFLNSQGVSVSSILVKYLPTHGTVYLTLLSSQFFFNCLHLSLSCVCGAPSSGHWFSIVAEFKCITIMLHFLFEVLCLVIVLGFACIGCLIISGCCVVHVCFCERSHVRLSVWIVNCDQVLLLLFLYICVCMRTCILILSASKYVLIVTFIKTNQLVTIKMWIQLRQKLPTEMCMCILRKKVGKGEGWMFHQTLEVVDARRAGP